MIVRIELTAALFLSRFPDLTGILIGVGLLAALILAAFVLALHRLRSGATRQSEAGDYGDDPPKTKMSGNEPRCPPSSPEK